MAAKQNCKPIFFFPFGNSSFFLTARLFMLLDAKKVLGQIQLLILFLDIFPHFFLFFIYVFYCIFLCFSCLDFFIENTASTSFFTVTRWKFSLLHNSHHFDLILQFYLEILPQFLFREYHMKQSC